jgi:type IV pilus assembly protein PilX
MMRRQSGTSLIIVVILLVILMISALALVRSSETVGAIAGNVAFKQAATEAADTGLAAAGQWVTALANADTAVAGVYYATRQNVDVHGLPTVNWAGVPAATVSNFRVQYVIERLCQGATPIANVVSQCLTTENTQEGSKKVGSPAYTGTTAVYYRVTVRVQGPRNAESYVQSLLSK